MTKSIIAAVASDWAIGKDNRLLWHISEDMKYFRKTTSGHPVIMGRRTWESIGRPLPGRLNIVVSRSGIPVRENVLCVSSLEEAFAAAQQSGNPASDECFVIGGAPLYSAALPFADKLYITRINASCPDADVFFPQIPEEFIRESISETFTDSENSLEFAFEILRRK
ncbi:MAG: dihydrofolate reductase [Bacteroidales bacterium]|nr:dihydrofolate reductase [Bacteroidales bacterium]